MVGQREQCRWALWAALILAIFIAYGCGAADPGAGGDDGAAHPGQDDPTGIGLGTNGAGQAAASDDLRVGNDSRADARTVGTDMDAAHSAAWMEALDGLAPVGMVVDSGDSNVVGGHSVEPSSVTAPTVAPAPYAVLDTSAQLTEAQMVDLLRQAGFTPDTWPRMLALGWCESKWSPNATGAAGERGIWQIHPDWHPDATYDPQGNANAAYRISSGGYDLSAWSCKVPY